MEQSNYIKKGAGTVTIQIHVLFTQTDDVTFVAYCPALELSSFGDTLEDAKEAFNEVLKIFIKETTRKGTLDKELLSLGWTLRKIPQPKYSPPRLIAKYKNLISSGAQTMTEELAIPV